jgi:hypothetical protein
MSVGLLGLVTLGAGIPPGVAHRTPVVRSSAGPSALAIAPCPSGTLPDIDVCVHVSGAPAESAVHAHRDVQDRWVDPRNLTPLK